MNLARTSATTQQLLRLSLLASLALVWLLPHSASAHDAPPTRTVGGHVGLALPIATIADESTVIGRDFIDLGITPGITVHLDERWSIDFEFIAFNRWNSGTTATTFVVDPGVVYNFGFMSAGLRVATEVGAPRNIAAVPIVVKPFAVGKGLSYFVELDLPLFFRDNGEEMKTSLTFLFQTGVGF